jgi:hypothetical protein
MRSQKCESGSLHTHFPLLSWWRGNSFLNVNKFSWGIKEETQTLKYKEMLLGGRSDKYFWLQVYNPWDASLPPAELFYFPLNGSRCLQSQYLRHVKSQPAGLGSRTYSLACQYPLIRKSNSAKT